MSEIFISYSSKDRAQADQLTELLASAGLSVWIDQAGIEAASSWSEEIVNALDGCKAFIVMLSPNSIESKNVVREVALAFEKNKKILPLDLEPVSLPASMQYHLAGLQRTSMTNIDAVIRALAKLGLEATGAPQAPKILQETDGRKSLMILPFEDLSPTGDNAWFADGIVSELIAALSNVKSLKLADSQATKEFKQYRGQLFAYAHEMQIRYFVQGDVRKFGDQIKIGVRLLDIERGDHLWQDSLKGTMQDVFEIQESVAAKVLAGLEIHLSKEEQSKVQERGTDNEEAWELWMKSIEYMGRETEAAHQHSIACLEEALRIDPKFGRAYGHLAQMFIMLFRATKDPSYLEKAEAAVEKAREYYGTSERFDWINTHLLLAKGDIAGALESAQRANAKAPNYAGGYHALAAVYRATGNLAGEIQARQAFVRIGDDSGGHSALLYALKLGGAAYASELKAAAERALPIFQRHARINPDDFRNRERLAYTFLEAGRPLEAVAEADRLPADSLDAESSFELACLYARVNALDKAIAALRRALQMGSLNTMPIETDSDLEAIRGTPEFEALIKEFATNPDA
ncbi:MAG: TIR domain-containing protein [Bacteroidota bacterium]|nr:TIR domain-containing protein [Bacteroidota bacterium]MDP4233581.1 TIR domain-containing protein [Bacteroidota bacterium]MDP4243645.1 TIR domain-containing protein [Bacteroidota bacterium]MDP4287768.1 TIR domain-containing protein [Bacteroidota bacterium]